MNRTILRRITVYQAISSTLWVLLCLVMLVYGVVSLLNGLPSLNGLLGVVVDKLITALLGIILGWHLGRFEGYLSRETGVERE